MTTEQIQQRQKQEAEKHQAALQIRFVLDEVQRQYAGDDWDTYGTEILALVTDDE